MMISKEKKVKGKFYLINVSITIVEKEGIRHYFLKDNNSDLLKIDKIDYLILNDLQTYGKIENELMILLKNNSYKEEDILKKINLYKKKQYIIDLDDDIDLVVNRNVFYRLNDYTYERENQLLLGNLNMKDKEYLFRKDEQKKQYNHLFKVNFQKELEKHQPLSKEDIIKRYKDFYFKNYLFYSVDIEKENLRYFITNELLQKGRITKNEHHKYNFVAP